MSSTDTVHPVLSLRPLGRHAPVRPSNPPHPPSRPSSRQPLPSTYRTTHSGAGSRPRTPGSATRRKTERLLWGSAAGWTTRDWATSPQTHGAGSLPPTAPPPPGGVDARLGGGMRMTGALLSARAAEAGGRSVCDASACSPDAGDSSCIRPVRTLESEPVKFWSAFTTSAVTYTAPSYLISL